MAEPKTREAWAPLTPDGRMGALTTISQEDPWVSPAGGTTISIPVIIVRKADYEKLLADAARTPMPEELRELIMGYGEPLPKHADGCDCWGCIMGRAYLGMAEEAHDG